MKIYLLYVILLIALPGFGQGVMFKEKPLEEVLAEAKNENKLVFVNCYVTSSPSCQQMDRQVLSQPTVGAFFNESFINLKVDLKNGEGPELVKRYGIKGSPTYLLLAADGKLRQKIGGMTTPDNLIQWIKNGMTYETSTSWFDDQYAAGARDSEFIGNYLMIIQNIYKDNELAIQVARNYLSTLSEDEKKSGKGWIVYKNGGLAPAGSEEFVFLINNRGPFEQQLTKGVVDNVIAARLGEVIVPYLTGRVLQGTKPEDAVKALNDLRGEVDHLLPGNKVLNVKIDLAKARCSGKVTELLDLLEENCAMLNTANDLSVIYFYCLAPMLSKITSEQQSRVFSLGQKSLEVISDPGFKSYFIQVMGELERRTNK